MPGSAASPPLKSPDSSGLYFLYEQAFQQTLAEREGILYFEEDIL